MSTPRRRVLTLLDHASAQGGAERFALALAVRLPEQYESWVCSTRWAHPEVARQLSEAGVRHLNLGRKAKWDVHRLAPLGRLLRRLDFDVIHAHMFGSNVWGSVLGGAFGVPVVIAHEHNWSYSGSRGRMLVDREVIGRLATRFVAVSEANRRRMIELEGISAEKIVVLPTAYVPHELEPSRRIRDELHLSSDDQLIGVAAVLRPEKALHVLIESVHRLVPNFPKLHLVIAGDGPCRPELERQISTLKLAEHVHLLGARRDVTAILQDVDIGAMSSEWEGMPLFLFECMATRTAIVATSVGGIPEVIRQGETGLLVAPGDVGALTGALAELLADPEKRGRMVERASQQIQGFTIEAVTARFVELYEQLLDERSMSPSGMLRHRVR